METVNNFNKDVNKTKVALWNCDKCGKTNTLCAYHNKFGWYCKECLTRIRDLMNVKLERINEYEKLITEVIENKESEYNDEE